MKRLMKFLLGLTLGAALAMLFTPKSGRELRQQLSGGASDKFLPPAPDDYPMPDGEREWGMDTSTAVAEPPVVDEADTDTVGSVEEVTAEPLAGDLRARIEETRSAIETEIAEPFAFVGAEAPVVAEESAEEPVAEPEPVAEVVEEPVAEIAEPVVEEVLPEAEPVVEESVAEEPIAEEVLPEPEPVVEEPVVEEPVAEEPVAEIAEPVAEEVLPEPEPVAEEDAAPSEAFEGPLYQAPPAEAEPMVEPVAEDVPPEAPRAWDAWKDEAPTEEPVAAEPVVEEPVTEIAEPVVEEVLPEPELVAEVVEEPAATEPVVEEPVAAPVQEPVAEAPPAAREGVAIDQAEMRRRIEETRARLKAKAFDAMMSGEAALLRNDSGEKPLPKGDEVDLEPEIDTTIDQSFSQDDD